MSVVEPAVFVVGAGPGDPGLLTLRAAEILGFADLVLYDQLVPRRILDYARPGAELVCVRDLPANNQDKYPALYARMVEAANAGLKVVRLKGGDPLVFGRGGEEVQALRAAGVNYEVVPGVTAALATAAYLDVPLTHRLHTSAVAFLTGHELPSKQNSRLDWEALARFPGLLAIYMGIARLPIIVSELIKCGRDPSTPALIAERVSTGEMRSVITTLSELEQARRKAGLEAPGLILIGDAVQHAATPSWFEKRPLFGRRVLVTRPRHQAGPMVRQLEKLGAVPFVLPTLEIREPADFTALDAVISKLGSYQWVVFASANGVTGLLKRLHTLGYDARRFGSCKLAAVGARTAAALREHGLNADIVPAEAFIAESLSAELKSQVVNQRVLLVRANRGRDHLSTELGTIAEVETVVAYEQHDTVDINAEVFTSLRRGEIEFVPFFSSNSARALLSQFDETLLGRVLRNEIKLVAISSETARAIEQLGFPVVATAQQATADGLIDAIRLLCASSGR